MLTCHEATSFCLPPVHLFIPFLSVPLLCALPEGNLFKISDALQEVRSFILPASPIMYCLYVLYTSSLSVIIQVTTFTLLIYFATHAFRSVSLQRRGLRCETRRSWRHLLHREQWPGEEPTDKRVQTFTHNNHLTSFSQTGIIRHESNVCFMCFRLVVVFKPQ